MTASPQKLTRSGIGGGVLAEMEHLEAPDRSFAGHRDIVTRSLARYHAVSAYVSGAVLDVGCGRGYGFEVLRPHSSSLAGVDISRPFLGEARRAYGDVALAQATGECLPFGDGSFDTVVAFEVIEHLHDDMGFLNDLKRLLRPGGTLAISTPNRLVASGESEKPLNRFHVREYRAAEFDGLLRAAFAQVTLLGQHERASAGTQRNKLVDRIPIGWKYLLPSHLQGMISVAVRPPLRIEDCTFASDMLNQAHTFVAICRA